MNPYLILNVARDNDDQGIRNAYLKAIKQFPPETHPERFQDLSSAYEKIKTEDRRYQHLLFDHSVAGDSPLDTMRKTMRAMHGIKPLSFEDMKAHLRHSFNP